MTIGSLNESPLHRALKDWYAGAGSRAEVPLAGFVADLVQADAGLVEIQTSGFGRLRRKLEALLPAHRVVLVYPVPVNRFLYRLPAAAPTPAGAASSAAIGAVIDGLIDAAGDRPLVPRRSPRHGAVVDVLHELVSLPDLLAHPNFQLEVALVDVDEFRVPVVRRGRDGWRTVERRLRTVHGQVRFAGPDALFGLVSAPLPECFSTADLARAMGASRAHAQKLAFCLHANGQIEMAGKQGNARLYRRVVGQEGNIVASGLKCADFSA